MAEQNRFVNNIELVDSIVAAAELAEVVAATIGPEGDTIIVSKPYGAPKVTKDGQEIISNMKPQDKKIAKIFELLTQATSQANEKAGDGTTTATILAAKMVLSARKHTAAGRSRTKLKNGMKLARDAVVSHIKSIAKKIDSNDEIAQIGTISANGNSEIGKKIAEAMQKVGKEGVITIEEGKGLEELDVSVVDGMVISRPYISPYFITNHEKSTVEFENPYILLANKKLSSIQPMVPLLESVVRSGRPILIIAEDVEGEALTSLILSKMRGSLKVCAIKAPGFGDRRAEMIEDIRILTGAKQVISDDLGINVEDLSLNDLGTAKSVTVTKDSTTIVDGAGDKDSINARVTQIKKQISETTSDYDKEKLQERLAKLAGGVAVLKVGGATEVEVKELKDRVEDALHATRAAVEEGIVTGGGVALLSAVNVLNKLKAEDDDEMAGINIVKDALSSPIFHIIQNAGENPHVIINHLLEKGLKNQIFDARKRKYVDAFEAGIIDPAKVTRVALESSISAASMLITTKGLIVDIPSKEDSSEGAGMGMGGMPGGYMGG